MSLRVLLLIIYLTISCFYVHKQNYNMWICNILDVVKRSIIDHFDRVVIGIKTRKYKCPGKRMLIRNAGYLST